MVLSHWKCILKSGRGRTCIADPCIKDIRWMNSALHCGPLIAAGCFAASSKAIASAAAMDHLLLQGHDELRNGLRIEETRTGYSQSHNKRCMHSGSLEQPIELGKLSIVRNPSWGNEKQWTLTRYPECGFWLPSISAGSRKGCYQDARDTSNWTTKVHWSRVDWCARWFTERPSPALRCELVDHGEQLRYAVQGGLRSEIFKIFVHGLTWWLRLTLKTRTKPTTEEKTPTVANEYPDLLVTVKGSLLDISPHQRISVWLLRLIIKRVGELFLSTKAVSLESLRKSWEGGKLEWKVGGVSSNVTYMEVDARTNPGLHAWKKDQESEPKVR